MTQEVSLGPVHPGIVPTTFRPSTDCKRAAYVVKRGSTGAVVVDGQPGREYDDFLAPVFSDDSRHIAYVAKRGKKWLVVVDGQESPEYDGIHENWGLTFPRDRRFPTYLAWRGKKWLVVFDGKEGKEFPRRRVAGGVVMPTVQFSADGKHMAYVATRGDKEFVVVDGQEGKGYQWIGSVSFSPDGGHVAYVGEEKQIYFNGPNRPPGMPTWEKGPMKWFVVVDGQEITHYEYWPPAQRPLGVTFLSDGRLVHGGIRRIKYLAPASRAYERFLVVDGQETPIPETLAGGKWGGGPITFSPDGKRMACTVKRDDKELVIVDGQESAAYDYVDVPVFSPDGGRVAYLARRGETRHVVVDGKEGPGREEIPVLASVGQGEGPLTRNLIFSPDGRRLAYEAGHGEKTYVVVDSLGSREYDFVGRLVFSPDGRHLGYRARRGDKWLVVMDGQEGGEYDFVHPPVFSPHGRHVAYLAFRDGRSFVVIDGEEAATYDGLPARAERFSRLVFDGDETLRTVIVRDGSFVRAEIALK